MFIDTLLIYSPDMLSRKYAYQVLLTEEISRNGVDVAFVNSPKAITLEEEFLLQFQGMIAEYERSQIIERSRRGKRHSAKTGSISVLSGAPYDYQYIKKTEDFPAYYNLNFARKRRFKALQCGSYWQQVFSSAPDQIIVPTRPSVSSTARCYNPASPPGKRHSCF